jgi:hypothetical protein
MTCNLCSDTALTSELCDKCWDSLKREIRERVLACACCKRVGWGKQFMRNNGDCHECHVKCPGLGGTCGVQDEYDDYDWNPRFDE